MFLKFDPYRVWCSIFYSKLVNCILFKIIVQHVRFVKGRGTCGSGERNVKIWIDFRKSPRFSLTSPLSQEREKSSRPVFTMCGEPCIEYTSPWPWSGFEQLLLHICNCQSNYHTITTTCQVWYDGKNMWGIKWRLGL
jgi:hypothetical protein